MDKVEAPVGADQRGEIERLAVFARTGVLDTPTEPRFDAIVAAVKAVCDVPIALVSLVDRDRQWFKASVGVEVRETPIDTSVCALAIREHALFVIRDLSADPRTRDFSLVTGPAGLRFYAGFPIVTGDGVAIGSVCAIDTVPRPTGVTEHQAVALEALARQAAIEIERATRGHAVLEGALPFSAGSWDWDIVNDRMSADARFARLIGAAPAAAAAGVPMEVFLTRVHPGDRDRVRTAIADTVAGRAPYSCEYRLFSDDGAMRWVLAQGTVVRGADGTPLHFPGATFDIDARRRAELRLAALVELNDRMREAGEPGALAYAAAKVLGETLDVGRTGYGRIDAAAETVEFGAHWTADGVEQLPALIHMRAFGSFIDQLKAGETVTIDDVADDPRTAGHLDRFEGLQVRSIINLPLIENGELVAMLIVNAPAPRAWRAEDVELVKEIAERTRHAVERRRVQVELEGLNASLEAEVETRTSALLVAEEHLRQSLKMEAVGQLTGGLAHDFNNLLTGISGAVELMQLRVKQGRTDTLDRYAEAAQTAVTRAAALTHRLLAFSRRQTLDPKPTDVEVLVAGMEDMIRRTIGPQHGLVALHGADVWTTLVDPNQLENALLNLCINARDAMPGGGRIVVATENATLDAASAQARDLPPGDYVVLRVVDTGTGMSPEVKARAFDPFYTTKPLGEGTGLGLSMIYGFARQSGGQVDIATEIGGGTTMSILLPRHHGAGVTELRVLGPSTAGPVAATSRTVLVVDDETTIRMLVAEAVTDMGHTVIEAVDGPSALVALETHGAAIDLLVTDIGLPGGMNGRQIADAAIAQFPDLPTLFITGYAETAVIGRDPLEANTALITKPFTLDALAAKVREMLA